MNAVQFIQDLRFKYDPLSDVYQQLWKEFMDNDLQASRAFVHSQFWKLMRPSGSGEPDRSLRRLPLESFLLSKAFLPLRRGAPHPGQGLRLQLPAGPWGLVGTPLAASLLLSHVGSVRPSASPEADLKGSHGSVPPGWAPREARYCGGG